MQMNSSGARGSSSRRIRLKGVLFFEFFLRGALKTFLVVVLSNASAFVCTDTSLCSHNWFLVRLHTLCGRLSRTFCAYYMGTY